MQHHSNVMMTDIAATNLSSKEVHCSLWLVTYKVCQAQNRHRTSALQNVIAYRFLCRNLVPEHSRTLVAEPYQIQVFYSSHLKNAPHTQQESNPAKIHKYDIIWYSRSTIFESQSDLQTQPACKVRQSRVARQSLSNLSACIQLDSDTMLL